MEDSELKLGMKVKFNSEGIKVYRSDSIRTENGKSYDLDAIHTIIEIREQKYKIMQAFPNCNKYVVTDLNSHGIWASLIEPVIEKTEIEEIEDESPIQIEIIRRE